jgi:hypothetical protein
MYTPLRLPSPSWAAVMGMRRGRPRELRVQTLLNRVSRLQALVQGGRVRITAV